MNDNKMIFQSMHEIDKSMRTFIWGTDSPFSTFVGIGVALVLLLTLIMIARMAYKMMVLDGKLDMLKFIRPAMIAAVLAYWPVVTSTLNSFALPVESYFMGLYENTASELSSLREQRIMAAKTIGNKLREEKTKADISELIADNTVKEKETEEDGSENKNGFANKVSEFFSSIYHIADLSLISKNLMISSSYMSKFFESIIFWLGEVYWEVSAFYIFLLKNLFLAALVIVGPVTIACSLLPAWEDSWKNWLGRMISVSFYGALAYMVMTMSMYLIRYGLEADIKTLTRITNDDLGLYSLVKYELGLAGTVSLYFIALLVGGAALNMVPAIASWIFPTEGIRAAGNFLEGMIGTTVAVTTTAAKVAIAVTTGTAPATGTDNSNGSTNDEPSAEEENTKNKKYAEGISSEEKTDDATVTTGKSEDLPKDSEKEQDWPLWSKMIGNNREKEETYKNILNELEKMEQDSLVTEMITEASAYRHEEIKELSKKYGKDKRRFYQMAIKKTRDDLSLLKKGLTEYMEAILIGQERAFFLLYPRLNKNHLAAMLKEKGNIERELGSMLKQYKDLGGNPDELRSDEKEDKDKRSEYIRIKFISALAKEISLYEESIMNGNKDSFMRMRGYKENDIAFLYGKYHELKKDPAIKNDRNNGEDWNLDLRRKRYLDKLSDEKKTSSKSIRIEDLKRNEQEHIDTFRLLRQMADIHEELEAYEQAIREGKADEFMEERGYNDNSKSKLEKEFEELIQQWKKKQ
jgi:hypothetical protein